VSPLDCTRRPILAALLALAVSACVPRAKAGLAADVLPSWNEGQAKRAILGFIAAATSPGGADFIQPADRIATFDNDGTLWCEQPIVQVVFVQAQLKVKVARDPSLAARPAVKAALEGDLEYFKEAGEPAVMELLALTSAGSTQEQFDGEVRAFFQVAKHPKLGAPFTALGYRPMLELLAYLRANGFQTFLCSGGGADFMRSVSQSMYGIPPPQVIGSVLEKELVHRDGRAVLWRTPKIATINDKEGKPVNIDIHIGKRPVFAAGNVRSGGDIAMLEYSAGAPRRSLQILVDHDDAVREFAYQEKDGASLAAARKNGWTVVSMKRDWNVIFAK
jgi:phosphoserine phosphatase